MGGERNDRQAHTLALNLSARAGDLVRLRGTVGRPRRDRRHWVVRPDDLLVLGAGFANLRVEAAGERGPARLVKQCRGRSYRIVIFAPHHVAEQAYVSDSPDGGFPLNDADAHQHPNEPFEPPSPPPIWPRKAGGSCLMFAVPEQDSHRLWTLSRALRATLAVSPGALPPTLTPSIFIGTL